MARALYQKLGIKSGLRMTILNPPQDYPVLFEDVPFPLEWEELGSQMDLILFFPKDTRDLEERLPQLQDQIQQAGMIWVAWFKKASKIPTDLNEDIIRNTALQLKLVDVKVCAIDHRYSGLKLVIRKELRTT